MAISPGALGAVAILVACALLSLRIKRVPGLQMIVMRNQPVPMVRSTGGLRDTVFDVDYDKARAAWELEGSADWQRDGVDQSNGSAFFEALAHEARSSACL